MDKDLQEIIKEISILQQCNNENVVRYYGSYFVDSSSDLWIIMEFCAAGSIECNSAISPNLDIVAKDEREPAGNGGEVVQITKEPGMHNVIIDHQRQLFVDQYSSATLPFRVNVCSLADGSVVRSLFVNKVSRQS